MKILGNRFELFYEPFDPIYGTWNFGIQISLTALAIVFYKHCFGIMYLFKEER